MSICQLKAIPAMKRPPTEILIHNAMMADATGQDYFNCRLSKNRSNLGKLEKMIKAAHILSAVDKLPDIKRAMIISVCSPEFVGSSHKILRFALHAYINEAGQQFLNSEKDIERCYILVDMAIRNFNAEVWHRKHLIKDAEICRKLKLKQPNWKKKKKNWYRLYIGLLSFQRNIYLDGIERIDQVADAIFEEVE